MKISLAGRLSIPKGFKPCEVAKKQQEVRDDANGIQPQCAAMGAEGRDRKEHNPQPNQRHRNTKLDQGIDCDGQKPATDPSNREFERNEFRCFDGKLILLFGHYDYSSLVGSTEVLLVPA